MATYSAYFDESGHPDKGSYLTVAGCVAETGQWVAFEREWLEVLKPFGTQVFHTVDFDRKKPPFHNLEETEADSLFAHLVGIICRRINKSFTHIIPLDEYRAVNEKYILAEAYGYPYPAAARNCIALVGEWASQYSIADEEILCVFEDGAKHKGQLEWVAERDRKPIPDFRKKSDVVALQAADLLGWCTNSYLTSRAKIRYRYEKALDRLSSLANEWGISKSFQDIDELPTILSIPTRDPRFRYRCKIVRYNGRRRAVIRYWPKAMSIEPKAQRSTIILPDPPPLTAEEGAIARARYRESKIHSVVSE